MEARGKCGAEFSEQLSAHQDVFATMRMIVVRST